MVKRGVQGRITKLEGQRRATTVTIEMELCSTQHEYEQAFALACQHVPDGSTIYCWLRPLSEAEFCAMATGHVLQPHNVMGIYRKAPQARA